MSERFVTFEKFRAEGWPLNHWYAYKGENHSSPVDIVQNGILGFCPCGDPETNLEFVMEGLKLIGTYQDIEYEKRKELEAGFFGSEAIAYFFYYWADTVELTEHGGSVPGWLSDKGREVIAMIEDLKAHEWYEEE